MPWKTEANKIKATAEAAAIWKLYGFESPSDLVLEDIAFAMGILVMDGTLEGADAWLVRKGNRGIIRVSDTIPETGRRRYAISHEIGHWSLHKGVSQILACTNADMVAKYKASVSEIEANYFGSELLMPKHLFRPRIQSERPSVELVNSLAREFNTSRTATAVRIADLSTDYFAVVVSRENKIGWWRGSSLFEEKMWIEAGAPLSRNTIASHFFHGQSIPSGPQKVDAEAWISQRRGFDDDYLFEEVIPMPRYEQVLSLIWLA